MEVDVVDGLDLVDEVDEVRHSPSACGPPRSLRRQRSVWIGFYRRVCAFLARA